MRNASMRPAWPPSSSARHAPSFPPPRRRLPRKRWSPAHSSPIEARADAELAAARAGAAKAKAVNADIKRSTATLDGRDAAQDRRQQMNNPSNLPIPLDDRRRRRRGLVCGLCLSPEAPGRFRTGARQAHCVAGRTALANRAPVAIKDAEGAVVLAEMTEKDLVLAAHRVYIADRKVDTARALAQTQFAEEERTALNEQAKRRASIRVPVKPMSRRPMPWSRALRVPSRKSLPASARSDADAAQFAANASQQQAAELQRQLEILQARPTDRGLVLTLGDTLFATGKSEIKSGATVNLDRLTRS